MSGACWEWLCATQPHLEQRTLGTQGRTSLSTSRDQPWKIHVSSVTSSPTCPSFLCMFHLSLSSSSLPLISLEASHLTPRASAKRGHNGDNNAVPPKERLPHHNLLHPPPGMRCRSSVDPSYILRSHSVPPPQIRDAQLRLQIRSPRLRDYHLRASSRSSVLPSISWRHHFRPPAPAPLRPVWRSTHI